MAAMLQVPNLVKSDLVFNERLTEFSVDIYKWGRTPWKGTLFVDGDVHFPRPWPFGLSSALWLGLLPEIFSDEGAFSFPLNPGNSYLIASGGRRGRFLLL